MSRDKLLDPIWDTGIAPALVLLPSAMSSPQAWHMLLAIGLQESGLVHRVQVLDGGGKGPARGLWQFERSGGVLGVLTHAQTKDHAARVCEARSVAPDSVAVWGRLAGDDVLAAAFARLLLWSDQGALPGKDDSDAAWRLYALRTWRPGRPHREKWDACHARARAFVYGE